MWQGGIPPSHLVSNLSQCGQEGRGVYKPARRHPPGIPGTTCHGLHQRPPTSNNKHGRTQGGSSRTQGGVECEYTKMRSRFEWVRMRAQKVRRIISFLFLLLIINGEGTLPAFLFNQIQRGRRPYDPSPPFLTPFDTNGEGSTPPHSLSTHFDAIGEGATPPHPFRPLLTQAGRVQPLPACY